MGIDEINPLVDEFVQCCEQATTPVDLPVQLFCKIIYEDIHSLSVANQNNITKCIAFFSTHPDEETSQAAISYVAERIYQDTAVLDDLINALKPSLLGFGAKSKHQKASQPGLNPKLGFSFDEDETKRAWKENGGLKSIALFYIVLLNLKRNMVSVNLQWIIPGIMNLLDDSTDLLNIKLNGVMLLKTFVDSCFDEFKSEETQWISFQQTGIFGMVEPILVNMCYFLPPSHNSSEVVLENVYECLISLYGRNFDTTEMKQHLGSTLLSKVILQYTIPKLGIKYEGILEYLISTTTRIIELLDSDSVLYMQRIIYTYGEYIIRDPFVTTLKNCEIMPSIIEMFVKLVTVCPSDRVNVHGLDFLAIVLITYQKYTTEGGIDSILLERLRKFLALLKSGGCDFDDACIEVLKVNPMMSVLLQDT